MKCPMCEKGYMTKVTVIDYKAKLGGIEFDVVDAQLLRCDLCNEEAYHAKEVRRWEKILIQKYKRILSGHIGEYSNAQETYVARFPGGLLSY